MMNTTAPLQVWVFDVQVGFGGVLALHDRPSTLYRIHLLEKVLRDSVALFLERPCGRTRRCAGRHVGAALADPRALRGRAGVRAWANILMCRQGRISLSRQSMNCLLPAFLSCFARLRAVSSERRRLCSVTPRADRVPQALAGAARLAGARGRGRRGQPWAGTSFSCPPPPRGLFCMKNH
jgi:hypothetical protein